MWPFTKKRKEKFPPVLEEYDALNFKVPSDLSIEDSAYVVLDCETTGITKNDEIITIGAVIYESQSIQLNHILDLTRTLDRSGEESTIHGELSNQLVQDEQLLIEETIRFLSNKVIVGHHISFDVQMVQLWIAHHYPGFRLKNQVIDTLQLIKRLDPQRIERRVAGHDVLQLDALCQEYGIEVENRHTALGDAYMTAQLFHRLIVQLEKRGITQLRGLIR
jgi:DNA polymerase-3 subunit epsilon